MSQKKSVKRKTAAKKTLGEPGAPTNTFWDAVPDVEPEQSITEEETNEVKSEVRRNDSYVLEETETRNVIMVGRTRSGKSTCIGVLKDTCYKPKDFSIFSETAEPKFASFALMSKKGKGRTTKKYTINMIDTPGLFEQKETGETARSNEMIVRTISQCVEHEVTSVNCLMIFASFEAGIRSDDIQALQHFLHLFGGTGVNTSLVITRSENRTTKSKSELIVQLQKHPALGPIIKEKNINILFMGCVDYATTVSDQKSLMKAYKPVYFMREHALQWIFSSESKRLLSELPVLGGTIANAQLLLEEIISSMHYFSEVKDFDAKNLEQLAVYKSNWQEFLKVKQAVNSDKMPALYERLMCIARKIKSRTDISENIKSDLIGRFKFPKRADLCRYP